MKKLIIVQFHWALSGDPNNVFYMNYVLEFLQYPYEISNTPISQMRKLKLREAK